MRWYPPDKCLNCPLPVWIQKEHLNILSSYRGSIDCVQLINEEHMITGADDGWGGCSICCLHTFFLICISLFLNPLSSSLHDSQLRVPLECQQEETSQHREAGSRLPRWRGAGAASLGGLGRSASELRHSRLRCLRLWESSLIETLVLCDWSTNL